MEEIMADGTITFGKYVGYLASEVPLQYLIWASSSLASPPQCVIDELKRRADMHGSRDSVEAAAAVSSLLFKGSTKKGKRRKGKWLRQKIAKHYQR
jgi:hypothetical protein